MNVPGSDHLKSKFRTPELENEIKSRNASLKMQIRFDCMKYFGSQKMTNICNAWTFPWF
jgi:hypothetical protein